MSSSLRPAAHPVDRDVLGPARRVLVATAGVVLAVALGASLCVALVLHNLTSGRLLHPSTLWLSVLAAALCWSAAGVLRRRVPPPPAVAVGRASAPGLFELVDAVAAEVGVRAPGTALLGLTVEARLHHHDGELALLIGAPLVWGATEEELVRVLRPVLATAPEAEVRTVRWARLLTAKVSDAPVEGLLTAPLFRLLRRSSTRSAEDLALRMDVAAVTRTALLPTCRPEDLEHVAQAWSVVLHCWAVPAWRRGYGPARLGAAVAELVEGTEQAWSTGGARPVAVGLLRDAAATDRHLSALTARHLCGGAPRVPVEWPEYGDVVLGPERREAASRLLTAVDLVLGAPGPATPARVLDALEDGAAAAVTGILGTPSGAAPTDVEPLAGALSALVVCAAETDGVDRVAVSWSTGPTFVTGAPLPDVASALQDAAHGRTSALREVLLVLGIPLDQPVWTSGDDPVDLGPQAVAAVSDVWHRGRTYDLVLCRDRLLLVLAAGRGPDVRGALDHYAGDRSRDDDRLRRLLEADLRVAVAQSPHSFEVPLGDVVHVRLRAFLSRLMWRAVITTADRRVVLRNGRSPGTALLLRDLLDPVLGDRLSARVDPRFPRLARVSPAWAVCCAALAAVLLAAAGWAALAGQVVPATVVGWVDARTCVVGYVDPWTSGPARAEVDCPAVVPDPLPVLALPAPFRGEAVEAGSAQAAVVLATSLLVVPAACGTALRVRQTRRADQRRADLA